MGTHRSSLLVGLVWVLGLGGANGALATVPLQTGLGGPRDYGTDCLSPNDDGSSSSIDLTPAFPSGLRFFSDTHTSAFVNTNGNITFSGAEPVFTPEAFPVASRPMIAAYWADVDLRPPRRRRLPRLPRSHRRAWQRRLPEPHHQRHLVGPRARPPDHHLGSRRLLQLPTRAGDGLSDGADRGPRRLRHHPR